MSALFRAAGTVDFDRLYRRHAASVYRYAFAVLGNHADAEDVAQQTFMNAYRAIAQGTKPRKTENWLLRIAHNEVRRHFRNTQGKPYEVELDERLAHPAPERSEPSLADLIRALQHLPPTQRQALVMREFEGRSYAEIAELLDVTQSALEALLFRGRRALAEQLQGALTCAEAEEALSRRLDGRLPRRDGRRLKAHLRECPLCVRFGELQKRQRTLLKGISIMPVPASLFLFRGEQAAAAGLGMSVVGAGGSTAVAGGGAATAAAGATGFAATFAMKAAAVTAAVGVVGGVGYGVSTSPAAPKPGAKVVSAAPAAKPPHGTPAALVGRPRVRAAQPSSAMPVPAHPREKAAKGKAQRERVAPPRSEAFVSARKPRGEHARPHEKAPPAAKAHPAPQATTKAKTPAPRAQARPAAGKRLGQLRAERERPARPAPGPDKPKPAREKDPASPAEPAERGPTK